MTRHIDLAEFREQGFLQEANRQFFHPLGLALEMTIITEGGNGDDNMRQRIRGALDRYSGVDRTTDDFGTSGVPFLATAIDEMTEAILAELFPVGSARLSGVWDYRDDPEGVLFGDAPPDAREKEIHVSEERLRHRPERLRLFGNE